MRRKNSKSTRLVRRLAATSGVMLAALGGAASALGAQDGALSNRSIGYVITDIRWAVYETQDGKDECPQGLAELGPREQYKLKFPDDGTKRKFADTALAHEMEIWWPTTAPDRFPYREAAGKTSLGLNLDGKTKPTDFTSPDGEPGIDNQLFRVIGCLGNYRSGGSLLTEETNSFKRAKIDRMLIELTNVDSLVNDNDVTLTTYRGLDELVYDALGKNQPGGTQRVELLWGKPLIRQVKGKIVNGVLTTEPVEFIMPADTRGGANYEKVRDARFKLKLTPESADGFIGGYFDVETFYNGRNRNYSTQHQSYGRQAEQSVYKVLRKYADAYPDAKTGENTAISGAFAVRMTQVFVLHSEKEIAESVPAPATKRLADSSAASVSRTK